MTLPVVSPLVSPAWLDAHLTDPSVVVLHATVELPAPRFDGDHRATSGRAAWLTGRMPGARHADLLRALAEPAAAHSFTLPPPARQYAALAALGVGTESRVVIYDEGKGIWAARLWWMLRALGIDASVLDGGWPAWRAGDYPVESGEAPPPAPAALASSPRPGLWADRAAVEAILAGTRPGTLICALGVASFRGDVPTRYARRGHIPGSRNLPYADLFDAAGRYRPPAALRSQLEAGTTGAVPPPVLYCGGGISACALALGFTLAGWREIAVYAGSLAEWSADPVLPLQRGE